MTDDLEDLTSRVLAWRKHNDGGHLHAKPNNQFCVNWDHGGYHEIGCMYDTKTASRPEVDGVVVSRLVTPWEARP